MLVLGIDVGTQGARALACDAAGNVLAEAEQPFPLTTNPKLPEGWFEQDPEDWWNATEQVLRAVVCQLGDKKLDPVAIQGISVTSTSGTVCAVRKDGRPLGLAIMYNDRRAETEAEEINRVGADLARKLGYRFAASFALPKILWLQRHEPKRFYNAAHFISPTDFILGRLTGGYAETDYTNALKTGYDLIEKRWPEFVGRDLQIPEGQLPRVVPPGTWIGSLARNGETGLPGGVKVLAGMTDGCASQVATGAVGLNQWNSTLGTTLVIKGVTREIIRDPSGRVYCHRHPDGYWLPGGASNTGGECIARTFEPTKLDSLGSTALRLAPTNVIAYPLVKTGERFPFAHPKAEGFLIGDAIDEATLFTAYLEGVGYVERLAYHVLENFGAEVSNEIHVAGGANKAAAWLQIRADVLQKTLLVPTHSGAAMGAAIIAAGGTIHKGIVPAARAMVRIVTRVEPRRERKAAYDERYNRFCTELRGRGYI